MATINQAVTELTRSRNLEDLKISAMERYIREFGDVIDRSPEEIASDPLDALHNADFVRNHPDNSKIVAAKNARRSLLNFLGTRSPIRESIDQTLLKLVDFTYDTLGQKATDKIAGWDLTSFNDPFKYARTVAFHSKLGLFNPLQLVLQAQSMTHVIGVAGPVNGFQGSAAAILAQFARMTKKSNIIDHFGTMSTKFGWKKEEFLEAHKEFRSSGLFRIEGEVAQLDDVIDPSMFKSKIGTFFDKGTIFFREGERMVRTAAYFTAYREWRKANPTKALDNIARQGIMTRTSDLFVNMTRASNAGVQQGVFSLPTQFLSFQVRLMEQMLGKRLTPREKMRAITTYSVMYGLPIGTLGITLGGVAPVYEDVRKAALERGLDVDNQATELFFSGLPQFMLKVATGENVNFAQRFGPGGLGAFEEALFGEKGVIEIMFGASGSITNSMLNHALPFFGSLADVTSGEQGQLPVLVSDFMDLTAEISSVNNVTKALYALNSGKYVTRNEIPVDDVNTVQAMLLAIGLTPTEISDAFLKIGSLKDLTAHQEPMRKGFIKYTRKAWQAESIEEADAFFKKAKVYYETGGFTPMDKVRMIKDAVRGHTHLVPKVNLMFRKRFSPELGSE